MKNLSEISNKGDSNEMNLSISKVLYFVSQYTESLLVVGLTQSGQWQLNFIELL